MDYFDKINKGHASGENQRAALSDQFEASRVKYVLKSLGLGRYAAELRRLWGESHATPQLKFAAFNARFPSFPFVIGCDKLLVPVHRDKASTEPSRYKRFENVPFVASYLEFANGLRADYGDRSCALLFPRKGFAEGFVIHNDVTETYWTSGLCQVYKSELPGSEKLYVQPFRYLMAAIARTFSSH